MNICIESIDLLSNYHYFYSNNVSSISLVNVFKYFRISSVFTSPDKLFHKFTTN